MGELKQEKEVVLLIYLFIQLSDLFGVSLDYLILGRSGNGLPKGATVTQLKSDIENLMEHLEWFKTSL